MNRTIILKELQKLLLSIPYVVLATTNPDGSALATPVFGCWDDELTLYWISDTKSHHSLNIDHESRVSLVVFSTSMTEDDAKGFYASGRTRRLKRPAEIKRALQTYRANTYAGMTAKDLTADKSLAVYCFRPMAIWTNGGKTTKGWWHDSRQVAS